MKLASDRNHPDYHDVVNFVQAIMVNGVTAKYAVHIDTELDEAQCVSQPPKVRDGNVVTHVVKGKVTIEWRKPLTSPNGAVGGGSQKLFELIKADWEERELLRKQEVYSI